MVYCGKCKKYVTEISIRDAATTLDYENIQLKVGNYEFGEGPDYIALEVHYHHECKREYLINKSQDRKKEIAKRSSNIESKVKLVAINEIVRYINTSIVAENKPEFLITILEWYKQVHLAQEGASKDVESYSAQSFFKKKFLINNN